jgi:hypothetical protein
MGKAALSPAAVEEARFAVFVAEVASGRLDYLAIDVTLGKDACLASFRQ